MTWARAGCAWWKSPASRNCCPPARPKWPKAWRSTPTTRTAAKIPPDDPRIAVRRAQSRLCGVRRQRPLRTANARLRARHGSRALRVSAFRKWDVDMTHPLVRHGPQPLHVCARRCVRVCWHIEGAGTKNVSGRGAKSRIITDLNQPWGESDTCTACGKCVMSCPTGALFYKGRHRGGNGARPRQTGIHRHRTGEKTMDRIKLATVWLGGCSGCHMSFLDLDELLIDLAAKAESRFQPGRGHEGISRRTWTWC